MRKNAQEQDTEDDHLDTLSALRAVFTLILNGIRFNTSLCSNIKPLLGDDNIKLMLVFKEPEIKVNVKSEEVCFSAEEIAIDLNTVSAKYFTIDEKSNSKDDKIFSSGSKPVNFEFEYFENISIKNPKPVKAQNLTLDEALNISHFSISSKYLDKITLTLKEGLNIPKEIEDR